MALGLIMAIVAALALEAPKETLVLGNVDAAVMKVTSDGPFVLRSTLDVSGTSVSLARVRRPQFAFVAAVDSSAYAFALLKLAGRGDAHVTTKPNQSVSVRVAGETFGPVIADAEGTAIVPVLVPPGIYEGGFGARSLDLGLSRRSAVLVALAADAVTVNADSTIAFFVFVADAAGAMSTARPVIDASVGQVSALQAEAPGVWRGAWSVPARSLGALTLAATILGDEPGAHTATLMGNPGPAATLTITCPARVVAGEPVAVTHAAFDAAGNLARSAVELDGKPSFERAGPAEITGRSGTARGACQVDVEPAEAAKLELLPEGLALKLVARDAYGNETRTPGTVTASASEGSVAIDGALVRHDASRHEIDRDVTIAVASGALHMEQTLVVPAAKRHVFMLVTAGLVSNFEALTSPLFALTAGAEVPIARQRFYAAASADYAWRSQTTYGREDFVSLTARIGYRPRLARRFNLDIALAAGVAIVQNETTSVGGRILERGAAHVLEVLLGSHIPLWQGGPAIGLRLRWQGDPQMSSVNGHLIALVADIGYRFEL